MASIKGWGDQDPWFINYIGHPLQGSVTGWIQVQNDPAAQGIEFGATKEYWIVVCALWPGTLHIVLSSRSGH